MSKYGWALKNLRIGCNKESIVEPIKHWGQFNRYNKKKKNVNLKNLNHLFS